MADQIIGPIQQAPEQTPQQKCELSPGMVWDSHRNECITEKEALNRRGGAPSKEDVPRGVPLTPEQSKKLEGAKEFQESLQGGTSAALRIERNKQAAAQQAATTAEVADIQANAPRIGDIQLNPQEFGGALGTEMPLLGGAARSVAATVTDLFGSDKVQGLGSLSEEEINSLAISEIQKTELKKGLSASEKVGRLIEAIPGAAVLGSWVNLETPRSNAEEVYKDIKTLRRQIQKIESDVRYGYQRTEAAEIQIEDFEQLVIARQARLKLLIQNSPSLEFNSDRINSMETDIYAVLRAINNAKITIANGRTELDQSGYALEQSMIDSQNDVWEESNDWWGK